MTLLTQKNTIVYNGTTGQDTFTYTFRVDQKVDMFIFIDTLLVAQSDFTITGLGASIGGDIILDTPLVANAVITLSRNVPATQEVDYQPFDAFPAETHEQALDKLTMLVQQNAERVLNSLRYPVGDSGASVLPLSFTRALKYVFFDEVGNVTVSEGTAIGGEGVKSIGVTPDSITMLLVNNESIENPLIGVNNINDAGGLMKLTEQGDYPNFPNLPGGGIPIETLANTPFLLFAVLIDGLDAQGNAIPPQQPGVLSTEMLLTYRQSNPDDPFGPGDRIAHADPVAQILEAQRGLDREQDVELRHESRDGERLAELP